MLEKLKVAEARFDEIEEKLSSPDVASDPEAYKNLMKERKNLAPIIEKYRDYTKAESDAEEAKALLDEPLDSEMKEMALEELRASKEAAEKYFEELKVLLLPRDLSERFGAAGDHLSRRRRCRSDQIRHRVRSRTG